MTTPGSTLELNAKQNEALELLSGPARHILLFGGSRSGKTFLLLYAIAVRALAVPSRHVVLRHRFNHLKSSVIYDTLPKMMDIAFPGLARYCHMDKQDWFYTIPSNGGGHSEIWFGGLDEKERTEKILGNEYSTVMFNECSQIARGSRDIALTRLAQNTKLRLKAYYDENPPSKAHWTHRLFIEKLDPDTRQPLPKPELYAALRLNPADNKSNLKDDYFDELSSLPKRKRERFLEGEWGSETAGELWNIETLEKCRITEQMLDTVPDMKRICVAIDPSGSKGEEDKRSDEIGLVVCGLGADGKGYVIEDLSGKMGPEEWGRVAVSAFDRWAADCIVGEINFGGAMVEATIRAAQTLSGERLSSRRRIPFREVRASRGKIVRAEPIAYLFEKDSVKLLGYFPELEDQLCAMTTAGYIGDRSPDRADAMVWGFSYLFPAIADGKSDRPRPQIQNSTRYSPHRHAYR